MSFIKLDKITKFELNNAHTFGVEKSKYGGFTIHLDLDSETHQKIFQLFVDNKTNNNLYGTTMYLKTKKLSDKNEEELLNKGNQDISVHFETTGVYTRSGKRYLIFEVTKLFKLPNPDNFAQTPDEYDEIEQEEIC